MKNALILFVLIGVIMGIVEHIAQEFTKGNYIPFAVIAVPLGLMFGPDIYKRVKPWASKKILPILTRNHPDLAEAMGYAIGEDNTWHGMLEKAVTDFNQIQHWIKEIDDRKLLTEIKGLQLTSKRILDYLVSHPDRILSASRFINYYQDKTLAMLRQYVSLKSVGVGTSSENKSLSEELLRTFRGFSVAYINELRKIAGAELQDMEAEIKLAGRILKDDGIFTPPCKNDADKSVAVLPYSQSDQTEDYSEIDGLVYEMPTLWKTEYPMTKNPDVVDAQSKE